MRLPCVILSSSALICLLSVEGHADDAFFKPAVEARHPVFAIGPHGPPMMGLGAGVRVPLEWGTRSDQGVRFYLSMMLGGVVVVDHNLDLMRGSGGHYRLGVRVSL